MKIITEEMRYRKRLCEYAKKKWSDKCGKEVSYK